jgi:hypothetical protein
MPSNHPVHRAGHAAQLDRRERHQLAKLETSAAMTHREIQLRQHLVQAQMLADTTVAQTAMACVAGTAGCVAALRDAAPEVAEALAFLQAKHTANLAQRMDDFSWRP